MDSSRIVGQMAGNQAHDIVMKVQNGQPITQQEREVLKEALLNSAPASQEWKAYNAALSLSSGGGNMPTPTPAGGGQPWFPGLPDGVPNPLGGTGQQQPPSGTIQGGTGPSPHPAYVGGQAADYGHNIQFQTNNGTPIPNTPALRYGGRGTLADGVATGREAPVGGNLGTDWGPNGAIGAANPSLLLSANAQSGSWDTGQVPIDPVMGGMNAYGLEHYVNDPSYAAGQFSRQLSGGRGDYMSQYYEAPMTSALALAQAGVLGQGHGDTLMGGNEGSNEIAREADQFMQQMYGGDTAMFPDINAMTNEIYQRALNTDFTTKTDASGKDVTVDQMIDTTNNALYQISAFMPKDSQDWLASTLNGAAKQYKLDYGSGKTTSSYPEYLREMGITDALGING